MPWFSMGFDITVAVDSKMMVLAVKEKGIWKGQF